MTTRDCDFPYPDDWMTLEEDPAGFLACEVVRRLVFTSLFVWAGVYDIPRAAVVTLNLKNNRRS